VSVGGVCGWVSGCGLVWVGGEWGVWVSGCGLVWVGEWVWVCMGG